VYADTGERAERGRRVENRFKSIGVVQNERERERLRERDRERDRERERERERERDRERETERETERERERERRRAVVNTNIEFTRTLHIKFLEAAVLLLSKYKCRFFPLPQLIVNGQLLSNMLYIICLVKVM